MRMQARRLKGWEEAYELLKYGQTVWITTSEYTGWAVFKGTWPQGAGLYFLLPNGRTISASYENVYVKAI